MNIVMTTLTEKDLTRYHRQIMIPELREKGQNILKNARITVAGAGGLGSSVLLYLAAAGIGDIKVIDFDKVELSNLNRQVIHWEKDIGKSKVKSAAEKLSELNRDIRIEPVEEKITSENAIHLLKDRDAIVDCMDNFKTRYILNDAAIKLDIPLFHAACYSFEGRVTTIIPGKTPCLRCIMPVLPEERKSPIMGVSPAMTGALQASEVIKYFAGIGTLLANKMLIFDSLNSIYKTIDIKRNPDCPSCGSGRK